jgi:hypothetical protein
LPRGWAFAARTRGYCLVTRRAAGRRVTIRRLEPIRPASPAATRRPPTPCDLIGRASMAAGRIGVLPWAEPAAAAAALACSAAPPAPVARAGTAKDPTAANTAITTMTYAQVDFFIRNPALMMLP